MSDDGGGPAVRKPLDSAETAVRLDLLGIQEADRADCARLLARPAPADVVQALEKLEHRLGSFTREAVKDGGSEETWIEAILRFAPRVVWWHGQRGISPEDSALILADIGRQMATHRRVHGTFGLETWSWLTLQLTGTMFQLGRLQYHLVPSEAGPPGDNGQARQDPGGWVLDIHIPELSGEQAVLTPAAVDASLAHAGIFFATHFPDKPVSIATCSSWMLDPYLSRALPHSNIAAFARRFVVGQCTDAPEDAVYFTFRKRGLDNLHQLPRATSLQRAVLGRIDDGGTWQVGHGYLHLPRRGAAPGA